ncbi:MAG: thiol:disulfide interchange protein DsbA/DsbL [Burkholderiales bacterium]|nr:thiol:disulfide interchange protein DsbA/DsbL [Burkholderiales bacterium]MDE2432494.1 thiol:disulfide interchange protein DsbA/DsbL [Burkholderiales bacterium]
MNRRDFSIQTLGAMGLALASPGLALAQGTPVEGTNYVRLSQRAPTSAPAGKVEVIEFFWYGCPHCNHFEPYLEPWVGKLPADVYFRRVPVAFRENPFGIHQRLYFAVEALGLVSTLHTKIFHAIHEDQLKLDKPELIRDFIAKQGIDANKFMDTMNSFGVQTKCNQARALADAYKIDGVPAMGVAGWYFTNVGLNGNEVNTLATVDYLINKSRRAK